MLSITQELIDSLHFSDQTGQSPVLASSYIRTILKCGGVEDAAALLPVFLEKPSNFYRVGLLPVAATFGTNYIAHVLFSNCFDKTI
jgi:hypothetical protein